MGIARDHPDLSDLITGDLSAEEARRLDRHVAGCPTCTEEVTSLRAVRELIQDAPPEMLIDGPPADGDLLLARTLRQVRKDAPRVVSRSWLSNAAVAICLVGLALAVGVLIGRSRHGSQSVAEVPITPLPTSSPATTAPGVRTATATDAGTGARLTVSVTPAIGWIRLSAAVTGIPAGERCELVAIARDGSRHLAGSWLVSAAGATAGTSLNGSTLVDVADLAAVQVQNTSGKRFVTVGL
jgi:anti-sigma factor RsiW